MNEREKARSSKHVIYEETFDCNQPRPPALGQEQATITMEQFRYQKNETISPPQQIYLTWAESLHHLLQDPEGVKLFQKYLESEGAQHANPLQFWFVCEGLKKHDQDNIQKLVKCIYKRYFLKYSLPIDDELRKQIMKRIKSPQCLEPPITLFDEAQSQIEALISKTTYPNFIKSDMYLQYIQSIENVNTTGDNSEASTSSSPILNKENSITASGPLPTLHEDLELIMQSQPSFVLTSGTTSVSTGYHTPTPRLTKDTLLRSQKHRALDIRPKSEAFAGFVYRSGGAHIAYNSFNPVSRQDSEMQSLSSHSDARTESDSMSLHSIDSRPGRFHEKQIRHLAARNRETNLQQLFIPRTLRKDWEEKGRPPINPEECAAHAALLFEKLEKVKREQDSQELLRRRLRDSDSLSSLEDKGAAAAATLHFADDSDQDILDEHVSRVFSDHSVDSGMVRDFAELALIQQQQQQQQQVTAASDPADSGISLVSEATLPKDARVMTWLRESERSGGSGGGIAGVRSEMGERVVRKFRRERGSSLERATPAQPFVADPSMPPMTVPNVDFQLEETRRRLIEDEVRVKAKLRSSSKYYPDLAQSSQSTLRKSMRGQRATPVLPTEETTTAVFSFDDEQLPYRSKIPGVQITLKQFKEYLPKKGNYRFFFKTVCEDLCNQVTQEEVINDNDILPLWEGKIIAQMKPID